MSDEHDGDVTSPDLPSGLGSADEPTNPGVGTGEAFIATTAGAYRTVATLQALAESCPPFGSAGRRRHIEVFALTAGELGMLCFDIQRIALALNREEND
jgi:hypothetical protein